VRKGLTTLALSLILVIIGHAPARGAANPERVDVMRYPHARHAPFSELGAEEHLHGFAMRTCPQHLAGALGILPGGDRVPTIVSEERCETDKAGHLRQLCQDWHGIRLQLLRLV
jgi:hypothetical protein